MTENDSFYVDNRRFALPSTLFGESTIREGFTVQSTPRPYSVEIAPDDVGTAQYLEEQLRRANRPLLVIDRRVAALHYPRDTASVEVPRLELDATEEVKSLEGSLQVLEFLAEHKVAKDSMVFLVGGGILQDTAGLACGLYKRGVPWTLVPTTLLAQSDSCIGSKTGVNYRNTKNLIGMFAAPRDVLVHPGFVQTLDDNDVLSGLGEIFKLCVTGGERCLEHFEAHFPNARLRDPGAIAQLVAVALGVKRAVIEVDEFDTDLRRSLNFGHSIGHALEAVTDYGIPHGIAVSVGVLVECELSRILGHLKGALVERLADSIRGLVPLESQAILEDLPAASLLDALSLDKKVEGTLLKLAAPAALGRIEFLDLPLNAATIGILGSALDRAVASMKQTSGPDELAAS